MALRRAAIAVISRAREARVATGTTAEGRVGGSAFRFLSGGASTTDGEGETTTTETETATETTTTTAAAAEGESTVVVETAAGAKTAEPTSAGVKEKKRAKRKATTRKSKRMEPSPSVESNLYVKNLPLGTDTEGLKAVFKKFGPILAARALNPEGPYPGGLVRFVRAEHAKKAIEACEAGEINVEGSVGQVEVRMASKKGSDEDFKTDEAPASISRRRQRGASMVDLSSLVGDDGEPLDPVAAAASLEKREAELASRRLARADKLESQKAKAQEMSEARRAERLVRGQQNIKSFVPRYKRGTNVDLKFDPSLRAATTSRRSKDGAMAMNISQRKKRTPQANARRRGDPQDAKLQQMLNERIRQAQKIQDATKTYDYDRNEFTRVSTLLFTESLDETKAAVKPVLGGRQEISDEEYIDRHKDFLMDLAGISSEQEFEFLKNEALEASSQQRDYDRLMRKKAGLSPFTDNYLAERASLEAVIAEIPKENIFYEMSRLALDTLDANPEMKYADKIRLLERLERESRAVAE